MAAKWTVPGTVIRVIDGDTVKIDLDLGWGLHYVTNCRVAGINAPEVASAPGARAKAYAETLLPVGAPVTFVSHSLDKYGRALGSIVYSTGRDFAAEMLIVGHAIRC